MRIIARRTLIRFAEGLQGRHDHSAVKDALDVWFHHASRAHWRNAAEVKRSFATASIVNADRIVFNIKGNDYRLIVAIDFEKSILWIKWIGSHRDYDRIDAAKVEYD
ncbi:type II toxin-antitoxin system HigB family toxin [Pseudomonas sp. R2.Fl]|nr:type II toxin-antitoxin system HigB family toxin [Pseudomonas sp. R2.Fl]